MAKKHRFLLGAALGATAGILFAPKSGKATRAELKKGSKAAYRKARATGASTVKSAKHVKNTVTRDAKRAAASVTPKSAKKSPAKKTTAKKTSAKKTTKKK